MATALKLERIKKGLKQYRLAQLVGINPTELSLYEQGRRRCPVELRYRIAKFLECPVEQVFPDERSD